MIKLGVFSAGPWKCGRTCTPGHACRFTAVLSSMGVRQTVVSHTRKVAVEFRDPDALRAAVEAMGGRWIGHGTAHRMFDGSQHSGHAFALPGWSYPLIATDAGSLAYDDYNGRWGNVADLDAVRGGYAIEAALMAAAAQGWQSERHADGTATVFHPEGGTFKVTPAGIEGAGFCGTGCEEPGRILADAMGRTTESGLTADYYAEHNRIQTSSE